VTTSKQHACISRNATLLKVAVTLEGLPVRGSYHSCLRFSQHVGSTRCLKPRDQEPCGDCYCICLTSPQPPAHHMLPLPTPPYLGAVRGAQGHHPGHHPTVIHPRRAPGTRELGHALSRQQCCKLKLLEYVLTQRLACKENSIAQHVRMLLQHVIASGILELLSCSPTCPSIIRADSLNPPSGTGPANTSSSASTRGPAGMTLLGSPTRLSGCVDV
jgi:hypothetical protein